ncbi:aromatic prenyltransferase [Purpureocillium lavendulum]|uniref:Aromatic prenyltransferase n=1 Tax=Purpureocillium lavendulum TaxID=1247861 RepID=A0AB34FJ60_9HYPO|nr:aromatic prenyltransferase [Purpureocillium lavendulum]
MPAVDSEIPSRWGLGGDFTLWWSGNSQHEIAIQRNDTLIWSTSKDYSFVSASSGDDVFAGESGNFMITEVDDNKCEGLAVEELEYVPWNNSLTCNSVAVRGQLLDCGSAGGNFSAYFWVPRDLPDRIAFQVDVASSGGGASAAFTKTHLTFRSHADEDFYGLGAQASFASLKNLSVPVFSREQGVGRGDEPTTQIQDFVAFFAGGDRFTTYTAIPQYVSTDAKAFYLEDARTAYASFDFTRADAVTVRYGGPSVSGQFLRADAMLEAVGRTTDYVGRMRPLPRWVDDGAIVGIQGGQGKVERVVNAASDADCPVVGVWLQDWCGTPTGINISRLWWNWESDAALYPQWPAFVQRLRDRYAVRTLTYLNPFLANVSTKADGVRRSLLDEARAASYLVRNATTRDAALVPNGPGIEAGILDLRNGAARRWFARVLVDQVWSANISGFMCDFGEYTPVTSDTRFGDDDDGAAPSSSSSSSSSSSLSPLVYHNRYPRDWASFQQDVLKALPRSPASASASREDDAVIFHRSAALGAGRSMNLFWAGDQSIAWARNDGIKSVVSILGHMGASGYAHAHSDVGGYTSTFVLPNAANPYGAVGRTAELLGRWGELAAVSSAVFRSHEGNIPGINAQAYTNASTMAWYAHSARLFRALGPYRRRVLDGECATNGWPLLRLPVLHHPRDARARRIGFESFFLGPDLYVAPVLDPGVTEVKVYLPGSTKDSYTHVWSGVTFAGGDDATVEAPWGKPAVFVVNHAATPELSSLMDFVRKENGTLAKRHQPACHPPTARVSTQRRGAGTSGQALHRPPSYPRSRLKRKNMETSAMPPARTELRPQASKRRLAAAASGVPSRGVLGCAASAAMVSISERKCSAKGPSKAAMSSRSRVAESRAGVALTLSRYSWKSLSAGRNASSNFC